MEILNTKDQEPERSYLVQPFKQRIIWQDPLTDYKTCALEKLHKDLSFRYTILEYDGSIEDTLREAIRRGKVNGSGWVRVTAYMYEFSDVWQIAMKKVGRKEYFQLDHPENEQPKQKQKPRQQPEASLESAGQGSLFT